MNIFFAVVVLGVMGIFFGLVLAAASRIFAVETDERLEHILNYLPGANCGGCGFAGCSAFANAVISGEADCGGCAPGGSDTAAKLAEIMGIQMTKNERLVAFVGCSGGERAKKKFIYAGIDDCVAALKVGGKGPMECSYGCLGMGTCLKACSFGAIYIEGGVAHIDHEKCTGCQICVASCPQNIIKPVPYEADINIACSSHDKGGALRAICEIGCLGCRICEKVCQHDAVHIADNLAEIDHAKCVSCGDCALKCPRKLIVDSHLNKEFDTKSAV